MNATQNMPETWKPIVGWEGLYSVSDHGKVRSEPRMSPRRNGSFYTVRGRELKQWPNKTDNHYMVVMSGEGRRKYAYVHSLVAESFIGPRAKGMEVRHLDDDFQNNHISNLTYGTRSENSYDRVRNGIHHWAKRDRCSRGHIYEGDNLKVMENSTGRGTFRRCVACMKMYGYVSRHKGEDLNRQKISDSYYQRIMGQEVGS